MGAQVRVLLQPDTCDDDERVWLSDTQHSFWTANATAGSSPKGEQTIVSNFYMTVVGLVRLIWLILHVSS